MSWSLTHGAEVINGTGTPICHWTSKFHWWLYSKWPSTRASREPFAWLLPLDIWAFGFCWPHPSHDRPICRWIIESYYRCYSLCSNSHPLTHRFRVHGHRLYSRKKIAEDKGPVLVGIKISYSSGWCGLVRIWDQWRWYYWGYQEDLDCIDDDGGWGCMYIELVAFGTPGIGQ